MQEPRQVHETTLAARRQAVAETERRANAIATARLVVVAAILGLIGTVAWAHLASGARGVAIGALVAAIVALVVLVIVHGRVHAAKERAGAAVRFHEHALSRISGQWRAAGEGLRRARSYASEEHPYAGDLDIFGRASLFSLLDVTSTRFGEEVLGRWLAGEGQDKDDFLESVKARQVAVRDLAPRLRLREELAVLGSLLSEEKPDPRPFVMWAGQSGQQEGRALPGWLFVPAIVGPLLTCATLGAASAGLVPRLAILGPLVVSIGILTAFRPRLQPMLEAASSKESALTRFGGMLALIEAESFEAPALCELQRRLQNNGASATEEMASLSRIVGFLDARNNEVFRFLIGPLLMWDLWCALALDKWRARAGRVAFGWFKALAELEALASLAGFAFEHPDTTFPELVGEPAFEAQGLGHPLIEPTKRVSNDVKLGGPGYSLVVTGSNMSGKSTLLRALGINAVLANVGAPVCAKRLRMGRLRVATSMRVSDSLEEGTSRFYAELKKLKLVVQMARESAGTSRTVLFLLDEILHGTNTRERLIGARAILKELLSRQAMGAVSTHDLSLGDLEQELPTQVRNVHFEEQVEGDKMTFDYRLREGVVQSSNALRLMRLIGLDVV